MLIAAMLVTHFAFGMAPSEGYEIRLNDSVVDTVSRSAGGVVKFESDLHGRFDLVPVGTVPIPPVDCPDLMPTNVLPGAPCGTDQEWWVRFDIINQGSAGAGPFRTRVSLTPPGGVRTTKCNFDTAALPIGDIAAQACRLASTVPVSPVGDWDIWIQVDVEDSVAESDETNNEW